MKRFWIAAALTLCLLGGAAFKGAAAEDAWMLAVNVGKGDAILVGVEDTVFLVDTGYPYVRGKILTAMQYMGISRLTGVFITHTDKDHVGGLEWLSASEIPVDAWYASAKYMETSEKKHPLAVAARSRGTEPQWLEAGDSVPIGTAALSVLAPIEMATDKDDNNSLVLMLDTSEGRILLTGDIEIPAEEILIDSGADLKCDVLKVANHADNDTTSEEFVQAARPKAAVISTSSEEKPGTPSGKVIRRLQKIQAAVACTQDAGLGVLVRLSKGEPTVEMLDMKPKEWHVQIETIEREDDRIVLSNKGTEAVNLSEWYLYSGRGDEMYVFPEVVIEPGATLTIGTLSTKGQADLVWQDKKVIHQKKDDMLFLYDVYGFCVSRMNNGL